MATSDLLPPQRHIALISTERQDPAATNAATTALPEKAPRKEKTPDRLAYEAEVVQEGKERAALSASAYAKQIEREIEDLKFDRALPEDQWPASIRKSRAEYTGPGGQLVPERPCLTLPKLDQPCEQVLAEARNARLALHVKPKGAKANKEGAELRQGMLRAIQIDSQAMLHRMWALNRALKCGRGWYQVKKVYLEDGDFLMDLAVDEFLNQHNIFPDPFAKKPDHQDSDFYLIVEDFEEAEYRRRWPDSEVAGASAEALTQMGAEAPTWVVSEKGKRTIRVAQYWRVVYRDRVLILRAKEEGANEEPMWLDALPKDVQQMLQAGIDSGEIQSRVVPVRQVEWFLINAKEILDEEKWEGRWIPIIPVIGKRYVVQGDVCYKGVVSNAKDAQRSYNYMRSAQVEAVGLAPKAAWVMAEGQDEGYELQWDAANTTNFTRLIYKPTTYEGQLVPPPDRNVVEPAIQAITLAVKEADADIKATTGRFDPSLGRPGQERSGKAIDALKLSGETGTSTYGENLATISMPHEGRILLDMLKYVYDSKGRIVKLLGEEPNDERMVMLNHPFIEGRKGELPQAYKPPSELLDKIQGGMQNLGARMGIGKGRPQPKLYSLQAGAGDYGIEVVIGKSYPTQRQEESDIMGKILEAAPQLTPVLADLWLELNDSPVAQRAAKRLKKFNKVQDEDEEQPEIPPEIKAQMDALAQQHEELTKALEATQKALKEQTLSKQLELDSKERIAALGAQKDIAIAAAKMGSEQDRMRFEAEASKAQAMMDIIMARMAHGHEMASGEADAAHAAEQAEADRQHEATMDARGRAHEAGMAGAAATHEHDILGREHDQALEQMESAAELAPEPAPEGGEE